MTKEIDDLNGQRTALRAKWQSERDLLEKVQKNKQLIDDYKLEAAAAERSGDYGKVAEIRYGKIQEAENEIKTLQAEIEKNHAAGAMIKEEIDAEDIAEVVARWTGIPVSRMLQSEREKLLQMESVLHERVIGQDKAIEAIANAVRRSQVPDCRTRAVRSARSSSWERPASGKPNWPKHWPSTCSTTIR